jgi:hypothetical protein
MQPELLSSEEPVFGDRSGSRLVPRTHLPPWRFGAAVGFLETGKMSGQYRTFRAYHRCDETSHGGETKRSVAGPRQSAAVDEAPRAAELKGLDG